MQEGVIEAEFLQVTREFSRTLIRQPEEIFANRDEQTKFIDELGSEAREQYTLHELMISYATKTNYIPTTHDSAAMSSVLDLTDLRHPYEIYSTARSMKRDIIYHAGPTNSGTHDDVHSDAFYVLN